jgi:hypothetical protein
MSYEIKIQFDNDIDAYVMEYGNTDGIVLRSDTYETAVAEAADIVAEWA